MEELAAEKVLGWTSKDQTRHYIDLAYIARDYGSQLDGEKTAALIREKFAREAHGRRYRHVSTLSQLASSFSAPRRVKRVLDSWDADLGTQILFLPEEQDRPGDSLSDFAQVERYVNDVWVPILAEVARIPVHR